MSRWATLHNRLKEQASVDLLGPGQLAAASKILEAARYANRINFTGNPGVGKTFVAWALSRSRGATYAAHPDLIRRPERSQVSVIMVDNAPSDWRSERQLYHHLTDWANSVVLITLEPIQDQIVAIDLSLSSDDVENAAKVMRMLGAEPSVSRAEADGGLWNLLL